jgi:pyrroloquinoline quinone biosynthesis protein B
MGWAVDSRVRWRTQTSLAVTLDGERFLLVDAAPDLRQQILQTPALHPIGENRNSPIRAVVVTSGDVDHIAGLLTLRERSSFDLFATAAVHAGLASDAVFRALAPNLVKRKPMRLDECCDTGVGLAITPFAVPGKTPLYREGATVDLGTETEDVIGLEISARGARALYVPGCARVTRALLDRAAGADALLFDGTTFTEDEMPTLGVSEKTAARMGHLPMSGPDGSLRALADCTARRKIYIHINNTNPVLIEDGDQRAEVERSGWSVAHDGMTIDLSEGM